MPRLSEQELERRWNERVASGTFSASCKGVGTIRIFGKSGDAPIAFPRVESLEAIETLEPDEVWAVRRAEEIIRAAQEKNRPVITKTSNDVATTQPVGEFQPMLDNVLILSMTTGG